MVEISKVGIIVNPNSGKDIRRLVGYGSVCDNVDKTDIVKRILIGLDAMGVDEILFMPDTYNFSYMAIEGMNIRDRERLINKVKTIEMNMYGTDMDSTVASNIMNRLDTDCIIVLGGDGTSRAVARGCKETPILPISTGTNNVFPYNIEGTIAGFIAGVYCTNKIEKNKVLYNVKSIELFIDGKFKSFALVDLVIYDDPFVGSKALWKPEKIKFVAVTRADIGNMGISSIISNFKAISPRDNFGLYCYVNEEMPKFTVKAPLAPGLICEVPISSYAEVNIDERIKIDVKSKNNWVTIAFDGEREHEVNIEKQVLEIEIKRSKTLLIDPAKVLKEAVNMGLLINETGDGTVVRRL